MVLAYLKDTVDRQVPSKLKQQGPSRMFGISPDEPRTVVETSESKVIMTGRQEDLNNLASRSDAGLVSF